MVSHNTEFTRKLRVRFYEFS